MNILRFETDVLQHIHAYPIVPQYTFLVDPYLINGVKWQQRRVRVC